MPKSPQKWPFPNRTLLGLDRDTPGVCSTRVSHASILPN
ncbi:hypothetical protein F383_32921 [Gossypium arboreum]|uniref:Uncharacterized protein n=1 Tax=Gossypium arboreum TaxID=29729 RepID=A0A0B0N3K7_GOSAR|nr:hypothetical protein F383_32921 [Gossypium arboreum]